MGKEQKKDKQKGVKKVKYSIQFLLFLFLYSSCNYSLHFKDKDKKMSLDDRLPKKGEGNIALDAEFCSYYCM